MKKNFERKEFGGACNWRLGESSQKGDNGDGNRQHLKESGKGGKGSKCLGKEGSVYHLLLLSTYYCYIYLLLWEDCISYWDLCLRL